MAALALGKPFQWKEISLTKEELKQYTGVYKIKNEGIRYVMLENGQLYFAPKRGRKQTVKPYAKDKFFNDVSMITLEFNRNENNEIVSVTATNTSNIKSWDKTTEKLPENKEIKLDNEAQKLYFGKYELSPDFNITIFSENDKMYAQATGQRKVEIIALEKHQFKLTGINAELKFNLNDNGKVESLTLYQNGVHEAKKIEQ